MKYEHLWITGFWRRIGALILDTVLLGVLGLLLGLFFGDWFVQLGDWGRGIGFSVALIYFGALNSRLGGGQTLGKRALNIRVVDGKNECLSVGKSIARYFILSTPFILNGLQISPSQFTTLILALLSFIVIGGIFSIVYLYIFNRVTRQSLHDLVVGSYVVNVDSEPESLRPVWKYHYGVVCFLFVSTLLIPVFTSELAENESFAALIKSQQALSQIEPVRFAAVTSTTSYLNTVVDGESTSTSITIQAFLTQDVTHDEDLARTLGRLLLKTHPAANEKDAINVVLVYGYDIGIASMWKNTKHPFVPDELREHPI